MDAVRGRKGRGMRGGGQGRDVAGGRGGRREGRAAAVTHLRE